MSNLILYKGILIAQGICTHYEIPGYADFTFESLKNISGSAIPLFKRMHAYLTGTLDTEEFERYWNIFNPQETADSINGYSPKLEHDKITFCPISNSYEEEFVFFYKTRHPFSQWYPCTFEIDKIRFNSTEQYMMYSKAMLFNNSSIAEKILSTDDPRQQKELGRQVQGFDPVKWDARALEIVYKGNFAKFSQNENLKKFLLDTGNKSLVEASPHDIIWGIGLSETDENRFDRTKWKGTNWLGEALVCVREDIRLAENKSEL
ncbi:MAG: NADAR family protein [Cytophaga sp.]|uniref:NADAR family protein n=1 Tax=Cytophaga sp. TaxID=29535 RepID=UPI003F7FE5AC